MGAGMFTGVGFFLGFIVKANAAASKLFNIIDTVPDVNPKGDNKVKIDPSTFKGEFKFSKVNFSYPTRPDL
jgi:hypothetical protein